MTSFEKALGEVIAQERKRQSLTQEALAHACGVHVTYISQLERGLKSPTIRVLRSIAGAVNTSASDLLKKT
jgi:transcriptional regulator with XRE-family HTH domain